jgi:hypothetical protein
MIKKKMSGIRKCLLNIEKKFLIFLKCAGFFLRKFAYVDKKELELNHGLHGRHGFELLTGAENTG